MDINTSFNKKNNFDLLRFIFATTVFVVHSSVLSGNAVLLSLASFISSELAVKSFFVVSGFLIFMSYENSKNILSFFLKRIRRIYPAYVFVISGLVVLGAFFTTCSAGDYWSFGTLKYFFVNLVFLNFLQPTLPGLFPDNINSAVNGALWTLKIEVMFYVLVPIIVYCFNRFGRASVMLTLFLISVIYSLIFFELHRVYGRDYFFEIQRQLPGQLTFFIAGAAAYYYLDLFKKYFFCLLIVAIMAFSLKAYLPWLVFEPMVLAVLVGYFAIIFPCLGNFAKFGDFSYGIYILHFPILQLFIANNVLSDSPLFFLVSTGVTVLFFAIILWHLIEKPFLKKTHYGSK